MSVFLPYMCPYCANNYVSIGKMSSLIFNPDNSEGLEKKKKISHVDVFVSVLAGVEFNLLLLIVMISFDLVDCLSQLCSFSEVAPLLAFATALHFMSLPSRSPGYHDKTLCIFKFPMARIEHTLLDKQLQKIQYMVQNMGFILNSLLE